MNEEIVERVCKVQLVYELISKVKEIVQEENICGGHRGYVDDILATVEFELDNEIKNLKKQL